jgi:alkylated DNA nucleotide flippase Atl1
MTFAARSVDVGLAQRSGERSSQRERHPQAAQATRSVPPAFSPAAQAVADVVATIPRGQVITMGALRARLAVQSGRADLSAMVVGRTLALLAGAVARNLRGGGQARWPIWRVVNDNGQLPGNWPLDARWRAATLRDEGCVIRYAGNCWSTDAAVARKPE